MSVYPDKIRIDVDLGSGFVELLDVQIMSSINIHRGNEGTSQRDRVATTGTMNFELNNAEDNSAGKLGYYSLNHTNTLSGWRVGLDIRCVITYLTVDYIIFRGTIEAVVPRSGKYGQRKVKVSCVDWMDEASRARVRGLAIQIDKQSSEVFEAILAVVARQPPATNVQAGIDEYPYALDNALEAEVSVMSEFQRLAVSELGRVFVKADGTLVFEGRHKRPNAEIKETLTDIDIDKLDTSRGREEIINYSEVQAHPRRVDETATSDLFVLANKPMIPIGGVYTVTGLFRDPDARATRVGGTDMVTPLKGTDFKFNVEENDSGANLVDNLDVDATYYANSVELVITNNGAFDGYLTLMKCRGRGIYDYETTVSKGESAASVTAYGEIGFPLDMPYQDDPQIAKDAADFIVQQSKALYTTVKAATFIANRSDRLMKAMLQREISDKVKVEESVTGTASFIPPDETEAITPTSFFINAVRIQIWERGLIRCRWTLEPGDPFNYWILEKTGYTELGETTRLAYGAFVPGWILGESVLGTNTIVNA